MLFRSGFPVTIIGGLDSGKFASRRHEDAKNDFGKLTLGKAAQMFKKAVGSDDVEFIKEVLSYAVPNMEWHHAGKLPKQLKSNLLDLQTSI